jgi:hypothetical protein
MSLTFNQFQVELRKRGIDGNIAVVLTQMYEQQRESIEQLDQAMKILVALTETVQNFVALNESMGGQLAQLRQRVGLQEVVGSEPLTDEGDYHG